MKQIKLGMRWTKDWHDYEVTKVFKNGKVQITETWVSEDTWKDCKDVKNYNVSEDENGQFVWQDQYKEYAFNENEMDGYCWWARMYAVGAINGAEMEEATDNNSKEEMNMKNATAKGAQVQVVDFTAADGTRYTNTRPNYYYKKVDGKQVRISKAEWDVAWEQSGEAEKQVREAEAAKSDKEAEKKMNKKTVTARKPRRSKDIAFENNGLTLTARQVRFLQRIPEDDFYEQGLDSALWIDYFCGTIADEFNPMSAGAMVSTLREKGIVYVGVDKVDGKKSKFFGLTDLGKEIAQELGLN